MSMYTIIHTAKTKNTPPMGLCAFLRFHGLKVIEDRNETLVCTSINSEILEGFDGSDKA